jgi:hypothetical protein
LTVRRDLSTEDPTKLALGGVGPGERRRDVSQSQFGICLEAWYVRHVGDVGFKHTMSSNSIASPGTS